MADGHHKSCMVFLGCGEEKKPTEARNNDIEPTARTEKYITSIMDEESFDQRGGHSHARIKIHENNCEPRKEGPVGYIGTAV